MGPADVVLRFLESVGRRSEAEFYLNLFRAEPKEQFAALAVDANVARDAAEAVVLDLRFLHDLGLFPVVTLGLFAPAEAAEMATRLRRRLERDGVPAEIYGGGSPDELAEVAQKATRAGVIPILPLSAAPELEPPPEARLSPGSGEVEARFAKLGALVAALRSRKLIFLHRPGGLRVGGALVPLVNLTTDYAALVSSKELSRKERMLVVQSRRLVCELVPHRMSVAITSPLNLFRELFTVKGAGTLLRRGATLSRHPRAEGVDRERLGQLLASAFGRPARPEALERAYDCAHVIDGYRGAALVVETPLGTYLSKFAVDREAQGEGLGRDLWDDLHAEHATVFWRARPSNPIVDWYGKLCDGLVRTAEWNVYWKGLEAARIPEAISYALAQPLDVP
jgi:acetylglutamate kinase